jgi:hypothetical protein
LLLDEHPFSFLSSSSLLKINKTKKEKGKFYPLPFVGCVTFASCHSFITSSSSSTDASYLFIFFFVWSYISFYSVAPVLCVFVVDTDITTPIRCIGGQSTERKKYIYMSGARLFCISNLKKETSACLFRLYFFSPFIKTLS